MTMCNRGRDNVFTFNISTELYNQSKGVYNLLVRAISKHMNIYLILHLAHIAGCFIDTNTFAKYKNFCWKTGNKTDTAIG